MGRGIQASGFEFPAPNTWSRNERGQRQRSAGAPVGELCVSWALSQLSGQPGELRSAGLDAYEIALSRPSLTALVIPEGNQNPLDR